MAIGQKKPSIYNLVSVANGDLSVATYAQVREALTSLFKEVYGSDIDLSSASADGVLVMNLALLINGMLQTINYMFSALDVNQATGKYLDRLCALANVYRKSATYSTVTLTITIPDSSTETSVSIPTGFTAIDQNGNEWVYSGAAATVTKTAPLSIVAACSTAGPIAAQAGWINAAVDASLNIYVTNAEPAILGKTAESDAALRARKNQTSGNDGASVLEILKGSLLAITGINDVYVFNNVTGSHQTMADGVEVANHDVYVAIRLEPGVTIGSTVDGVSDTIGEMIYMKMTPGIRTADASGCAHGAAKEYKYNDPALGGRTTSFDTYARWKQTEDAPVTVDMALTVTGNFSGNADSVSSWDGLSGTARLIADAVSAYVTGLAIGEDLTATGLANAIEDADPGYRGRPTFDIDSLSVTLDEASTTFIAAGGTLSKSAKVSNPVTHFGLKATVAYDYEWNGDDGTVTIKLGG